MSTDHVHVIQASELAALVNEINDKLAADPDMASRLPLSPPDKVSSGMGGMGGSG